MDASKKSCPIKTTLLVAWQNAANNYSKAVSELSHKIGMLSKSEYERLKQEAEQARQRSIDAQANLDAHISKHGCDGNEEAVA